MFLVMVDVLCWLVVSSVCLEYVWLFVCSGLLGVVGLGCFRLGVLVVVRFLVVVR